MGRFTEEELREAYGDDEGWKAIVNQTDPDVEEFAGRGQRASSSRTGGGALVRADAETEEQQKKAKAKASTETRDGAKAKTAAPAQTAKGKRKQRDEEEAEEEEEGEEEAEKPKAKGKEAKKREESSKRALSPVRDLRAKSQVLRYLACSRRLPCDDPWTSPQLFFFPPDWQGASQEARPLAWPPR